MPTDVVLLVATAVLTAVAIAAAVVSVLALLRVRRESASPTAVDPDPSPSAIVPELDEAWGRPAAVPTVRADRLIVTPSEHQVVNTALGRPEVRISILVHALVYALRTESRDRIVALMRREYRRRRAARLRAGRRAARAARVVPADGWIQETWRAELPPLRDEGER